MKKPFEYEEIDQILAEANTILQQLDREVIELVEETQRIQLEQQAQSLKKLKSEVRIRSGRRNSSEQFLR